MTRFCSTLAVLLLPVLAGCTASYESQCDHLSELDDQVACLDLAFVQLRIGNTEAPEREALRGEREDCTDGEFATRGEDRYICDDGEWRSMDELDEDEDERDDEWDEDEDERDDEWDEDDANGDLDERDEQEVERSEAGEDFCTELEGRDEDFERCRSAVRGLDELHERTRDAAQRNANSGERRRLIRNALREGRESVRDELGRTRGERERPAGERERPAGEEDRAP